MVLARPLNRSGQTRLWIQPKRKENCEVRLKDGKVSRGFSCRWRKSIPYWGYSGEEAVNLGGWECGGGGGVGMGGVGGGAI